LEPLEKVRTRFIFLWVNPRRPPLMNNTDLRPIGIQRYLYTLNRLVVRKARGGAYAQRRVSLVYQSYRSLLETEARRYSFERQQETIRQPLRRQYLGRHLYDDLVLTEAHFSRNITGRGSRV
jgi:hypothetical protein